MKQPETGKDQHQAFPFALDQFGLCSITLGREFPVFHENPRETSFVTPL